MRTIELQPLDPRRLFAAAIYSLIDLGAAPSSGAYSVRSIVDGYYAGSRSISSREQAYLARLGGSVTSLAALSGANNSAAWAVNPAGDVVGSSYASGNRAGAHATEWSDGDVTDLGVGEALAVSDNGHNVVGISNSQPVYFNNGSAVTLGELPDGNGTSGKANGVNDNGKVVGSSGGRAFSYQNGEIFDLTFQAGGTSGEAFAVNANGVAVGQIDSRAFYTTNGNVVQALPTRGGSSSSDASVAYDINADGQVVGTTDDANAATLWQNGVGYKLADLVANLGDWTIDSAVSISDDNRILGYGTVGDDRHAFALVPGGASLSKSGTLTVTGSVEDDAINISTKSGKLRVTVNGVLTSYTLSKVKRINVNADAGDDAITLAPTVIGTGIDAGAGNDTIAGSDNSDHLVGGAGNDRLTGNGGRDTIEGGSGNDTLVGGSGIDSLDGGAGSDKSDVDGKDKSRRNIEGLV